MESILNNSLRHGNFTSSSIADLMTVGKDKVSFGKPALDYISEKNMERRLCRSLTCESYARSLVWGKFLESIVFELLGSEYYLVSKETIRHPDIDFWSGSPDVQMFGDVLTIGDIKCPITLKSFCQLVDGGTIEDVRNNHKDGEKYYWQLLSNACLTGAKYGELIVFVPYKSQLDSIREMATESEKWIHYASDEELPWLPDGCNYKNLNVIRFEIPQADKDLLKSKVIEAGNLLINRADLGNARIKNDK